MREVGRRLFDCTVTCEVLQITEDISSVIEGVAGQSFKEYVQFELHISRSNAKGDYSHEVAIVNGPADKNNPVAGKGFSLSYCMVINLKNL